MLHVTWRCWVLLNWKPQFEEIGFEDFSVHYSSIYLCTYVLFGETWDVFPHKTCKEKWHQEEVPDSTSFRCYSIIFNSWLCFWFEKLVLICCWAEKYSFVFSAHFLSSRDFFRVCLLPWPAETHVDLGICEWWICIVDITAWVTLLSPLSSECLHMHRA